MGTTIEAILMEARAAIARFTPRQAAAAVAGGAILVDIRPEAQRRRDGLVPGAVAVERNVLEWRLDPGCEYRDPRLARRDRPVILICDEGYQTSLAAALLGRFGVDAGDVVGGVQAWKEAGLGLLPFTAAEDPDRRPAPSVAPAAGPAGSDRSADG